MPRPLHVIARDIVHAWPHPYFGARPYLGAMLALQDIRDDYGADSARSVVLYFLSNAHTWGGPAARQLKAELKDLLKSP